MEQFLSQTSVQVLNRRVEIQAVPIAEHGIAFFTFSVMQTPSSSNSNLACISFCFPQASLHEESPRLQTIARMLSCVWGRAARPLSIETLQRHLSDFCHQTIQQRNGLGVGFFTHLFFPIARTQQQRTAATVRGKVTDEDLVFTAASNDNEEGETNRERGLETAIAKVERVDGVGVGEEDCCSICFEEFKSTMDHLDLLERRARTCFIMTALVGGWRGAEHVHRVDVRCNMKVCFTFMLYCFNVWDRLSWGRYLRTHRVGEERPTQMRRDRTQDEHT